MKARSGITNLAARSLVLIATALLSGCMSFYLDASVKEISPTEFRKPDIPHPVQLFFEFREKGVANTAVTNILKPLVTEQIRDSQLFSQVAETLASGDAILSITVDSLSLQNEQDIYSKGFVTGATFGLIGTEAMEGYKCTARHTMADTPPVVTEARQLLYLTVGATAKPPANGIRMADDRDAITTMTRQLVSHVLNALSRDPSFK